MHYVYKDNNRIYSSILCRFYIWFFFLRSLLVSKKENVWPCRQHQKSNLLYFWQSIGTWTDTIFMNGSREEWNGIFTKSSKSKEKFDYTSPNFSTWLCCTRKCEHELILFECKINYAKTFELIFIWNISTLRVLFSFPRALFMFQPMFSYRLHNSKTNKYVASKWLNYFQKYKFSSFV